MQPSFTIAEWCAHRKVSRSMFYKLESQGLAPKTHSVGVRRLIGPEADAEWLRQREAESGAAPVNSGNEIPVYFVDEDLSRRVNRAD